MITSLRENQIFVFGSNLAGSHAGGAALQAKEKFGAVEGVGIGMRGQSYAFPTLDENLRRLPRQRLRTGKFYLYVTCKANPEKEFLLTKVGCGIAGYDEDYMRSLFSGNRPPNLILPEDWR